MLGLPKGRYTCTSALIHTCIRGVYILHVVSHCLLESRCQNLYLITLMVYRKVCSGADPRSPNLIMQLGLHYITDIRLTKHNVCWKLQQCASQRLISMYGRRYESILCCARDNDALRDISRLAIWCSEKTGKRLWCRGSPSKCRVWQYGTINFLDNAFFVYQIHCGLPTYLSP